MCNLFMSIDTPIVTYERSVDHCEPSKYVKIVTINEIKYAENSDNLDCVRFDEIGWQAISRRDQFRVGDQVMFIPPESVLPTELSDLLNVTNYLSKGKVRVVRLRGNRSEGLIVDAEIVVPYIQYIMHWEDLPEAHMRGLGLSNKEVPIEFQKFYKMPNIMNEKYTFKEGELIYISEKLHGTNTRMGIFHHPETDEFMEYVGSHNVVLKEEGNEDNLYWKVYKNQIHGKLPNEFLFFGEIIGPNIQDLTYGRSKHEFVCFAIMKDGEYLPIPKVIDLCDRHDINRVNFEKITFESIDQVRELADLPSEFSTVNQLREGIVMVSAENPNRMCKVIGFNYLTRKNGKERH